MQKIEKILEEVSQYFLVYICLQIVTNREISLKNFPSNTKMKIVEYFDLEYKTVLIEVKNNKNSEIHIIIKFGWHMWQKPSLHRKSGGTVM